MSQLIRHHTTSPLALAAGPALATLVWLLPFPELTPEAHRLAGVVAWVVVWWATDAIPLAATSLFGVALATTLGVETASKGFASFGHPLIFLFMAGFLIAQAMRVHGLDKRIALFSLSRKWVGGNTNRVVFMLIGITAFLSMWISNTATTAMMLPIVTGVIANIDPEQRAGAARASLFLAVAYAASIGGIGTPVGSPPNLVVIGFLDELAGVKVGFLEWSMMTVPIMIVGLGCLSVITLFRMRNLPAQFSGDDLQYSFERLGGLSRAEKNTLLSAMIAVVLWITPSLASIVLGKGHELARFLKSTFPEASAGILAASLLFVLPTSSGDRTLNWRQASQIDWSSLILFGGGIALGKMMYSTGLAQIIGKTLLQQGGTGMTLALFCAIVVTVAIFFTEFSSNTATANMITPLIISATIALGYPPVVTALSAGLACNFAFMMPVATPPNAIVYSSGWIPIKTMIRQGFLMNLVCIAITLLSLPFIFWVLQ